MKNTWMNTYICNTMSIAIGYEIVGLVVLSLPLIDGLPVVERAVPFIVDSLIMTSKMGSYLASRMHLKVISYYFLLLINKPALVQQCD